jgi:hypothetical protein
MSTIDEAGPRPPPAVDGARLGTGRRGRARAVATDEKRAAALMERYAAAFPQSHRMAYPVAEAAQDMIGLLAMERDHSRIARLIADKPITTTARSA